jgi:hypothetical protein
MRGRGVPFLSTPMPAASKEEKKSQSTEPTHPTQDRRSRLLIHPDPEVRACISNLVTQLFRGFFRFFKLRSQKSQKGVGVFLIQVV